MFGDLFSESCDEGVWGGGGRGWWRKEDSLLGNKDDPIFRGYVLPDQHEFLLDMTHDCKVILEQSLLTGWLANLLASWPLELSASFPISSTQGRQNPGKGLNFLSRVVSQTCRYVVHRWIHFGRLESLAST